MTAWMLSRALAHVGGMSEIKVKVSDVSSQAQDSIKVKSEGSNINVSYEDENSSQYNYIIKSPDEKQGVVIKYGDKEDEIKTLQLTCVGDTDRDEDGLCDIYEGVYGTDESKKDTDGDGIEDVDEVFKYSTNPLSRKTNGYILEDRDAIENGILPIFEEDEQTRVINDDTEKMELQTNQAWFNLEQSWLRITMAQTALSDAEANLKITQDYYEAGLVALSDLLEAQTMLKNSRDELSDSRMDYRLNLVKYKQLTKM